MRAEPTVEFVIPFYGDPSYLRETVTSLLDQTDPAWTATVLDDCYPDPAVGAWVQSLGDQRLTVLRHEQNLGANESYQEALHLATADYLVILGADDRLLPEYVARVKAVITRTAATVVQPGVRVIDGAGDRHLPRADRMKNRLRPSAGTLHRGEAVIATLMRGNWTYFPSLCWERHTVAALGFRPYHVVQDLALLVDVLLRGGDLFVDDEVTFEYRRHAASDSAVRGLSGTRFDEERAYFRTIARELAERGWRRAAHAAVVRPMSRAHAASLLPVAVRDRQLAAVGRLARHAVAP